MRVGIVNQGPNAGGGFDIGGATLTGPLVLAGEPLVAMEAATKNYIDTAVQSLNAGHITTGILPVGRLPAFTGDLTNVEGSNVLTLSKTGVTPGTYTKVTVDTKGRVTEGKSLTLADVPNFSWNKITNNKPTTIDGYNISDAVKTDTDAMTGHLTLHANPTANEHAATKAYVDGLMTGSSVLSPGDTVRRTNPTTPAGFLRCNGAVLSRDSYVALFAAVRAGYDVYTTMDYTSNSVLGAGQPWNQQYDINNRPHGDLGAWTQENGLPYPAVAQGAVVVTKNRVFILGGYDTTGVTTKQVLTATIDSTGKLGAWTVTASLPLAVYAANAFVTKNRVYLIGGIWDSVTNNPYTAPVQSAPINTDGTLGAWSYSNTFPASIYDTQFVVTKNRVYSIGGRISNGASNLCYTAPINTDGTIGTWVNANINLPEYLIRHRIAMIKNKVYVLGGMGSGDKDNTKLYMSVIGSDGTLGAWTTYAGTTSPAGQSAGILVTKNSIFLFNVSSTATVQRAPIDADGNIGAFVAGTVTGAYGTYSCIFATSSRIYMTGRQSSGVNNDVWSASTTGGVNDYSSFYDGTINKFDGTSPANVLLYNNYDEATEPMIPGYGLPWRQQYQINETVNDQANVTGWTLDTDLPVTNHLYWSQAVVTKNRVYLISGNSYVSSSTGYTAAVITAPINADGTLGAWTAGTPLPIGITQAHSFVAKNRVYVVGGVTTNNNTLNYNTYSAVINADGTLGAWTTSAGPAICMGQVVVTKNRVYIIGGYTTDGVYLSAAYTAPINTDGTLGTWVSVAALPVALAWSQVIVTKNRVYMLGGSLSGTSITPNVYTAPINADGTLGAWTSGVALPTALSGAQAVVCKNCVYLMGGRTSGSGNTATNAIYRAPINADGTLGTWKLHTVLPVANSDAQVAVVKNQIYLFGGMGSKSVYRGIYAGGLNDYSQYYDGTFIATSKTMFALPDTTTTDPANIYTFIKI